MAGITKGILGCLQASNVAGGAGSYNNVAQMNALGAKFLMKNIDSTVFTCSAQEYVARITGMQHVEYTADGFFDDYGDTTGQTIIVDNAVNGAELWFKYLYDGTKFIKSQVMVDGIDIKTTPDGTIDVSFSAQSTGPITNG
jgi:hypothetical protein